MAGEMRVDPYSDEAGTTPPRLRASGAEHLDQLVPLIYRELRSVAHHQLMRGKRAGRRESLQTTALVNEAYVRLASRSRGRFKERAHFLAVAALAMRQILVERVRARRTVKRGGGVSAATLEDDALAVSDRPEEFLALEEALQRLEQLDERLAQIVVCRFYGGMTEEEIAKALGVTVRTVQRGWVQARVLLKRILDG